MKAKLRILSAGVRLAALMAGATVLLAACGGDNEAPPSPSPAATTAPAATPEGTPLSRLPGLPTPATTPVISGSLFEYPERGYSVRFPEGWTPEPNLLAQPEIATDVFFGPQEGEVRPNISVTCQPLPEGTTTEKYFEDKMALVDGQAGSKVEAQPAEVSGVEARRAVYSLSAQGSPTIEKVEVFFLNDRCGWSIALVTPLDRRAAFEAVLDQFLASFTLLP